MDFQICNMPQVLFPFAFIAGMWLWDTVLSKIFAEGTAPYFSGISVSSSAIPFVCRRLSASGIFVGCRILGIVPAVVRAAAPPAHSCRSPDCHSGYRPALSLPSFPFSFSSGRRTGGTPFRNSGPMLQKRFLHRQSVSLRVDFRKSSSASPSLSAGDGAKTINFATFAAV